MAYLIVKEDRMTEEKQPEISEEALAAYIPEEEKSDGEN